MNEMAGYMRGACRLDGFCILGGVHMMTMMMMMMEQALSYDVYISEGGWGRAMGMDCCVVVCLCMLVGQKGGKGGSL